MSQQNQTKQLKMQVSMLQSKLDKSEKGRVHEKMNSKQRRTSRSRTPKPRGKAIQDLPRGLKDVVNDMKDTYHKQHKVHTLDFSKMRAFQSAAADKQKYGEKLKAIIKTNNDLKCSHTFIGKNGYCTKCGVAQDEKDSKVMMLKETDDLQTLYQKICQEFDLARGALRAGLGNKPINIRLTANVIITTTVTTGVTNTIAVGGGSSALQASTCGEFSTMAALFDEFKCTHGMVSYIYNNSIIVLKTANAAINQNSIPIMAYDPADNTALANHMAATQTAQHETIQPIVSSGASAQEMALPASGVGPHKFHWKVPRGVMVEPSDGNSVGQEWQPTSGTPQNYGYLKFYHVGTEVTATDIGAGVVYFYCQFRCRS